MTYAAFMWLEDDGGTQRLQTNTLPFYTWDLRFLGFQYPWAWRAVKKVLEHDYKAVFGFIMFSHFLKKRKT